MIAAHAVPVDVVLVHCGTGEIGRVTDLDDRTVAGHDLADREQRESLEPAVLAEEVGDEIGCRLGQQLGGRCGLFETSADVQDHHSVAELDRLVDVVGDEHDRLLHPLLEVEQFVLQARTHDGVDRAVGLVHEEDGRVGGECTGHADALLLPARQRTGVAAEHRRLETDQLAQFVDPLGDPRLVPAEQARDGADVRPDGLVGEQARVLDHVADAASELVHREVADRGPLDLDRALGGLDQPVDHLERGRLAAARGADERHDLAGGHLQVERVDRGPLCARIALGEPCESDRRLPGHHREPTDWDHRRGRKQPAGAERPVPR